MQEKEHELSLGCGITILAAVFGPMFLLSVGGSVWGWNLILEQHRLLSTARETEAVIVASEVEWHPGPANDQKAEYLPIVRFSYSVDNKTHESSTVSPARSAGRHGWAEEIVRRFPTGKKTTAYYDPTDPATAFLLKKYLPDPYLLTAFASLFAGFAVVFPASFFWPWPRVRAGMALSAALVYELTLLAVVKHYFDHAAPEHDQAVLWSAVAIGLGIVPLLLALRWWRLDPKRVAKRMLEDDKRKSSAVDE